MITEVVDIEDVEGRCLLSLIEFLERNDFTSIRQVTRQVLSAKDGTKNVYIWYVVGKVFPTALPVEFFHLAEHDRARVDVVQMDVSGDRAVIRHMMNAGRP